jgi:hypothetical protein
MRKIEAQMNAAVRSRRDWHSGNTSVDNTDHGVVIRLHGHKICVLNDHNESGRAQLAITDAGWQTSTTKSRINALLAEFTKGARVYQSKFEWYLSESADKPVVSMECGEAYLVEGY